MSDIDIGLTALAREMLNCDAIRKGAELFGAPRFSVFDTMCSRETTLSRVLSDLLDPNGAHGQGDLFLVGLMRLLELNGRPKNVLVKLEAPVKVVDRENSRRLDILITADQFVIGIEIKLWARESENQLFDYLKYIKNIGSSKEYARLLFISPNLPSIVEEGIVSFPYFCENKGKLSVDTLLATARPNIKAPRVVEFVDDFRGWMGRTFDGIVQTNGMEAFMNAIVEGLDDGRKAQAIGAALLAGDKIHRHYIDRIEDKIRHALRGLYGDFSFSIGGEKHGNALLFDALWASGREAWWCARRPSWPRNCYICVSAGAKSFEGMIYGVGALDPESREGMNAYHSASTSEDILRINGLVQLVPEGDSANDWWRWIRSAPQTDWTLPSIATVLVDGHSSVEETFGVNRITDDLLALARAISGDLRISG